MRPENNRAAVSLRTYAAVLSASLVSANTASADGIDIYWYLTRVKGWRENPTHAAGMTAVLLGGNLLWNAALLGYAALTWGNATFGRVARDLVAYTLLAQILDRASGISSVFVVSVIAAQAGVQGEPLVSMSLGLGLIGNFVIASLAIGALARWYAVARWNIPRRIAIRVAVAAGILTNPAWLMFLWR